MDIDDYDANNSTNNSSSNNGTGDNSFQRFRQTLIDEGLIDPSLAPPIRPTAFYFRQEYLQQLLPSQMRAPVREFVRALGNGRGYHDLDEEEVSASSTPHDINDLALADRAFLRLSAIYLHSSGKTVETQEAFTRFDQAYRDTRDQLCIEDKQISEMDA